MFSIGEFARHGRVSVRMLRHYDAIGLIRPACVDVATGYRFYEASQLDELNRVIALKDLGFTLQQVQTILEEKVSAAELRGMLKLRRAEIQATIDAETTRLARVEARLMTIEDGARVPADGVVVKRLAPVRVAELTGVAAGYEPEAITPVIQPLYHDLWHRLASADIPAAGPPWRTTRTRPRRHPRARRRARGRRSRGRPGVSVVDLPEVDSAAAIIHHGSMDDVLPTGQALARWIDANGYRSAAYAREVTLHWCPDPEQWVTELQLPIDETGG